MRVGELRALIDGLDDNVTIVVYDDAGDWLHIDKVLDPRRNAALIWLTIYPSDQYASGREDGFYQDDCNTCGGTGRWRSTTEDSPISTVDLGPCPDCGWCEVCGSHLDAVTVNDWGEKAWRDPAGWYECWGEDHAGRTGKPHAHRAWGEEGAPI